MDSCSNYSLPQEFYSRPTPFSLFNGAHRDPNARLLDLASKSAQNRRRKRATEKTHHHAPRSPTFIQATSPGFERFLVFDTTKIHQVYSEVMMNSDDTPKATCSPTFHSPPLESNSSSGVKAAGRRRTSRQRPVSRHGPAVAASRAAVVAIVPPTSRQGSGVAPLPACSAGVGHRKRRSKVLTEALRKSRETREFTKSVDVSLAMRSPPSYAAYEGAEDEDDEDWAAFISSGYGGFPLPPTTNRTVSSATTSRSGSAPITPSTSSTSLASSSRLPKTGVDWLDDELAWASSDEETGGEQDEAKEVVQSPFVGRTFATASKRLSAKRQSGASSSCDVFCTPNTSPQMGLEAEGRKRASAERSPTSVALSQVESELVNGEAKPHSEQFKLLDQARMGAFGRANDRHCSVSSASSSQASSALSSEPFSADDVSTRPSSASSASVASLGSSPKQMLCSPVRPILVLSPSCESLPRRLSKGKADGPATPTRMTSLDHCVEAVGSEGAGSDPNRPLLGGWLSSEARHSALPRIEALGDEETCCKADGCPDTPVGSVKDAKLQSKSMTSLLQVNRDSQRIPRRSSRTSILANCDAEERMPGDRSNQSSIPYLHSPNGQQAQQMGGKGSQSSAGRLRTRLAAKMNNLTGSSPTPRASMPDVPVTPSSADSAAAVDATASLSPSSAIFGSAAINVRASAYAATSANNESTNWQQRRRVSSQCSFNALAFPRLNSSGFCFDYDPDSPLYLDDESINPSSKSPPPSSFWKKANAKVHEVSSTSDEQPGSIRAPLLKRRGSFRLWR